MKCYKQRDCTVRTVPPAVSPLFLPIDNASWIPTYVGRTMTSVLLFNDFSLHPHISRSNKQQTTTSTESTELKGLNRQKGGLDFFSKIETKALFHAVWEQNELV